MARIVAIHGIDSGPPEGQTDADRAADHHSQWAGSVIFGRRPVRASSDPAGFDDQLLRSLDLADVHFVYYADLLNPPVGTDPDEVEAGLAKAWLSSAASSAQDPRDRHLARQVLDAQVTTEESQGYQAALRSLVRGASRLRFVAEAGFRMQQGRVRALREVSVYMGDAGARSGAQDRLRRAIGTDTRVVLAHSLGTVVAYEALQTVQQPVSLVTLGSPLALRHVIYDRLDPTPGIVPECLRSWSDFLDRDDLVAAHSVLTRRFRSNSQGVAPTTNRRINNGADPHSAVNYLANPAVRRVVQETLTAE